MAEKKPLDIQTALQKESYRIRLNTLSPLLRKRFNRLTRIERIFYATVVSSALILAISLVFVRMKTLEIKTRTDNMRIEMENTKNQISQQAQEAQDLTSSNKVSQVATKKGLTMNNSSVTKLKK